MECGMTIKLAVPSDSVDVVRSRIYGFLSNWELTAPGGDCEIFITVFPVGENSEYQIEFADSAIAAAFMTYLPSILPHTPLRSSE